MREDEIEEEGSEIGILDTGVAVIEGVDRAAIDIQIATAKKYPRLASRCLSEAISLATMDEDTAESMLYVLERGKGAKKKYIEGPSARLAEIMAYSWGNIRAEADIVAEDATHVTAMGTCFDLEKNVAIRVRVKRRITDKEGRRFNSDMIGVTSNAAISIALRNAVFKVIPRSFVDRVYTKARSVSLGQGGTMAQKRQNAIEWFKKAGAKEADIFATLGVAGMDDIGEEQLVILRGLKNMIKEGESTVEKVFADRETTTGSAPTQELNRAIGTEPPPAPARSRRSPPNLGPRAEASQQEERQPKPTDAPDKDIDLLETLIANAADDMSFEDRERYERILRGRDAALVKSAIQELR